MSTAQEFRPLPADPSEWAAWCDGLPASQAMGLRCESIVRGTARMTLEESILPLNPNGAVHGGLVIGVADHVMGMAAMTVTEPGQAVATVSLTGNFQRPARLPLTFEAVVENAGRTVAFVSLTVHDGAGRACCQCVGNWTINRAAA